MLETMQKIPVQTNISKELFDKIEQERGIAKRATFIEKVLEDALREKKGEKGDYHTNDGADSI